MPGLQGELSIYARDGWRCRFCGIRVISRTARSVLARTFGLSTNWTSLSRHGHAGLYALASSLDHVHPHGRGGRNEESNFVTACYGCQFGRGDSRWGHIDENVHGDSGLFKLSGTGSAFEYEASIPYDSWILRAQAPAGQRFKVGTYATAPFATPSAAGLTLFERDADNTSEVFPKCGENGDQPGPGTLRVRKVRYDSAGRIDGLHASFEFRCEASGGREELPVKGDIRFNI